MKSYGKELILDLRDCRNPRFTRLDIELFFMELCDLIDMNRELMIFWDDLETPEDEKQTEPHLVGTSAIQFITTSNITIHTLDILKSVYLNIFSCKDFDETKAAIFCIRYFDSKDHNLSVIERR